MVEVEETLAADVTAGSVVVLKLTEKRATGRVALFFTLSAPRRPQPSCAAILLFIDGVLKPNFIKIGSHNPFVSGI